MGLRRPNQFDTVERTLRYVLRDLCVERGHCLPPDEVERIAKFPSITAEQFADEVLRAEGQSPGQPSDLVKRVSQFFVARVGARSLPKSVGPENDEPAA